MDFKDTYINKLSDLRLIFSNKELTEEFKCSLRTVTNLMNKPKLSTLILRFEMIDRVYNEHKQEIALKKKTSILR